MILIKKKIKKYKSYRVNEIIHCYYARNQYYTITDFKIEKIYQKENNRMYLARSLKGGYLKTFDDFDIKEFKRIQKIVELNNYIKLAYIL